MKKLIVATVAALGFATPAFAQDTASDFSGFRLEAIAGIDRVNAGGSGETGAAYGVAGGYDFGGSGVVFGIDGEVAFASTKECVGGTCVKASRDLYIGGRVGTEVSQGVLLYAKAGYTNARLKVTGFGGDNLDGVRVGAGVEVKLQSQMFVKAEYRYSNYEFDFSRHQGLIGLGVRF